MNSDNSLLTTVPYQPKWSDELDGGTNWTTRMINEYQNPGKKPREGGGGNSYWEDTRTDPHHWRKPPQVQRRRVGGTRRIQSGIPPPLEEINQRNSEESRSREGGPNQIGDPNSHTKHGRKARQGEQEEGVRVRVSVEG